MSDVLKKKSWWEKTGSFLLDLTEIYIPAITFCALFVAFMVQVFYRYLIVPLTWPLEFTLLMFIWTTLFGACYAHRKNEHVKFSMIYDNVSPKGKWWMRTIGNILLLTSFMISFIPTYHWIQFMSFKKSNVLKIPMNYAYSPYLVFMVVMMGRFIYELFMDVQRYRKGEF